MLQQDKVMDASQNDWPQRASQSISNIPTHTYTWTCNLLVNKTCMKITMTSPDPNPEYVL